MGAVPSHCLINANLITPLKGSSLDLDSKEGGGTEQKYGKIQFVSVSHERKLQVAPKSLTHTVQKLMAACRHLWEIQRRQEKSVSVLREQEWIVRGPVIKFPVESSKSVFASMWAVWWCNDGVRLCRQRSARRPRGKASTTWCHQRESRMTHQPQKRGVQRNFNEINLQSKTRKQHSFSLKK